MSAIRRERSGDAGRYPDLLTAVRIWACVRIRESLLVLCAPSREVAVGYRVSVSGNVQSFDYSAHRDDYALAPDVNRYRGFTAEELLVTTQAKQIESSQS